MHGLCESNNSKSLRTCRRGRDVHLHPDLRVNRKLAPQSVSDRQFHVLTIHLCRAESQAFQRELAGLSERYSQKCLELNRAEQNSAEREREISRKERDMEQLRKENQDLKARLKEEISRMRSTITDQSSEDNKDRTPCELEEKRLACERYTEIREELSGIKGRSEREIQSLKEHLRLAMAALQEGQKLGNSLDH
ncbi:TRIO and F-actin-binding protein [Collichthys lucidus]|uniref:TRIO and F-actin-binding protein n=1 Tax=Collichthys lucidus TaxID=240159 RepID=A0A4U5VSB7_COLLU|nr:TRIO and F-actin-binding protein [Collichthys lucidus]